MRSPRRHHRALTLTLLALLAPLSARAASEPWVRFEGVKKTRLELAWQNAVLTERKNLAIRLRVGGRGVRAVQLTDPFSIDLLKANPRRGEQVLSAKVRLGAGANLIQVCPITEAGRAKCYRMWIARIPRKGQPPVVALFEQPSFSETTFLRGVVLGHGVRSLSVHKASMSEPYLLDGKLDPRKTSHDFVAQVSMEAEEQEVCFIIGTSSGDEVRDCLRRCPEQGCAPGPRLHALIVTPYPVDRAGDDPSDHLGSDAVFLSQALRHQRFRSKDRVRLLTGRSATVEMVLSGLHQLLADAHHDDLLVFAYLGPYDPGASVGSMRLAGGRSAPGLTLQSVYDLVDQAPRSPALLMLVDGIDADGRGAGAPELTARKPACVITASRRGEPNIRSDKIGGSLFTQALVRRLDQAARPDAAALDAAGLFSALRVEAKAQSEGAQQPSLRCQGGVEAAGIVLTR